MAPETAPTAEDVIAEFLSAQAISDSYASDILRALTNAGFTILSEQDLSWGTCPNGGSHVVSLDLCSGCLQYDPE